MMKKLKALIAATGLSFAPRTLDGVDAREFAGKRRMQVDDHAREPAEKAHRQDPHPTGEDHPVGIESADDVREPGVVVRSGLAGMRGNVHVRHSCVGGALQRTAAGLVGHDSGNVGRQATVGTCIEDRLQICAAARREDDEACHRSCTRGPAFCAATRLPMTHVGSSIVC